MPTNFAVQSKTLRNLVLSANKQASWGETMADTYLTRRQRFDGSAVLDLGQTRRDDSNYAGRGSFFATNGQVTHWGSKVSGLKAEVSDWLAGWLCAMTFGADVVTGTGPYTHTFNYDQTTRTSVATCLYVEDTADLHYKLPDMCMNDLTLTISEIGAIMADWNMVGTGLYVAGSMASGPPALSSETYILGSDCVPQWGPTGSLATLTGRVANATVKWDNQLQPVNAPGLGLYSSFVRKGKPKFSFDVTIRSTTPDDVFTNFLADASTGLTLTANSGASAQLIITLAAAHLKAAKLGFDGDMNIWQLSYDETTAFQSGSTLPVSVQVVNGVAAYLAAE